MERRGLRGGARRVLFITILKGHILLFLLALLIFDIIVSIIYFYLFGIMCKVT